MYDIVQRLLCFFSQYPVVTEAVSRKRKAIIPAIIPETVTTRSAWSGRVAGSASTVALH